MVHSAYRQRGGEDVSFEAEAQLLQQRGNEVTTLIVRSADMAARPVASQAVALLKGDPAWRNDFLRRVRTWNPDVIYLNNWFPWLTALLPDMAHAAPLLTCVRNYRLWCINGLYYRDGQQCRECTQRSSWRGVRHSCFESFTNSMVATAVVTRARSHLLAQSRGHFLTNSRFMSTEMIDAGVDPCRVHEKSNVVFPKPPLGPGGDVALFVGRLEPEKGVEDFIAACAQTGVRPVVVGTGPLQGMGRATYHGELSHSQTLSLMGTSRVTVVPSRWAETFGRVAAESLGTGTPVIVSDRGALPEIGDQRCRQVFVAGNVSDLAACLARAFEDAYWAGPARVAAHLAFERAYSGAAVGAQLENALRATIAAAS